MSVPPLTPLDDAIVVARRLGATIALPPERLPLPEAVGRTVAEDVVARRALPGFASSAMDGFAVRAADLAGATADAPVALPIVDESRAGAPAARTVGPGEAIRIATGGVMPDGADAIVPYEQTEERDGEVRLAAAVAAGEFVRAAGTDLAVGAVIVPAGRRIGPGQLAPLAGAGHTDVAVRRRPRVSVLMTGDEVVRGAGPDAELPPGAVHDVNGVVVPALVRAWGGEVVETIGLPDDRDATREAIAAATGDLVVIGGGLSMGPHDHVRPALEQLGARQELFRIALQPGKPTWLGSLPADGAGGAGGAARPVFGLPGNPASVFVTATLLVRAALDAALGLPVRAPVRARLTAATSGLAGRTAARRATVATTDDGTLAVTILDGQASHLLGSLGDANALAIVPPERELPAGALVDVVLLDPPLAAAD